MKCLLCTRNFQDIQRHYIEKLKVNPTNWYFKALFKKGKKKFIRKYYRCDKILTSQKREKIHNFIKYYQKGGKLTLEYKPIEKILDKHLKHFQLIMKNTKTVMTLQILLNYQKNFLTLLI